MNTEPMRVVLIKPSKYGRDGFVERFARGFMPNSTIHHIGSMTPKHIGERSVVTRVVDEYVETTLDYLDELRGGRCTLLALVGVQSHQMHRALDLAALARARGVEHCVIGGPHAMTCDTKEVQGRGVSFALAEAELVWEQILSDACAGELAPVYGRDHRWQSELSPPPLTPPGPEQLRRYVIPMLGLYPARGCPYRCNFCSVVKIAGRAVRGEPIETTVESMRAAKRAGVKLVMFTSDNFNKYPNARPLLQRLIEENIRLPFFVQSDVQLSRDEELIELLARAGCAQVFVGAESFDRAALTEAGKHQNRPERYEELVRKCHVRGVSTHFSNIIGFPTQTARDIEDHVTQLIDVAPFMASFYILAPIPGTDQYEEMREEGLINEPNLDRFDATCSVWKHPHLDGPALERLLAKAYHRFYGARDVLHKMLGHRWNAPAFVHALGLGYAAFARLSAWRLEHPMAGGLMRRRLDHLDDYAALRRRTFGISMLGFPRSLPLQSRSDQSLYDVRPSEDIVSPTTLLSPRLVART